MLFLLFIYSCQSQMFTLIIETDKGNTLTWFNSTSMNYGPHIATLSNWDYILDQCSYNLGKAYFVSYNNNFDRFFNEINCVTGEELYRNRTLAHKLIFNKNELFCTTIIPGHYTIAQIINNSFIIKYVFPSEYSLIGSFNYFPNFEEYVVSFKYSSGTIFVLSNWKVVYSISLPDKYDVSDVPLRNKYNMTVLAYNRELEVTQLLIVNLQSKNYTVMITYGGVFAYDTYVDHSKSILYSVTNSNLGNKYYWIETDLNKMVTTKFQLLDYRIQCIVI